MKAGEAPHCKMQGIWKMWGNLIETLTEYHPQHVKKSFASQSGTSCKMEWYPMMFLGVHFAKCEEVQ